MQDEGDSFSQEGSENSDSRDDVATSGKKQIQDSASNKRNAKFLNKRRMAANDIDDQENDMDAEVSNIINVCGLIIDIEKISKQEILKMRKYLPKKDYRQLKNRKSARECRKKRKEERTGMMDELIQLRNDKIKLMAEVEVLTKQL